MPVGFATWAFLSEEVEKRMLESGVQKLSPMEWKSGDRIWSMDMIFPFGGAEEAKKEMQRVLFPGQTVRTLGLAPPGQSRVVTW
jgi:cytolysin-activating lysine-acyltransferase